MVQFKAFTGGVEVSGRTVLSLVDGMGAFRPAVLEILAENGIPDPKPGEWYPQQALLDTLRVIADRMGDATLFLVGQNLPEGAVFPDHVDTIDKALSAIDLAYHVSHRLRGEVLFDPGTGRTKDGIGHYKLMGVDGRSARVRCTNPHPCDLDRGIIKAVSERFRPTGSLWVQVSHEASVRCRKDGAESCTYLVQW